LIVKVNDDVLQKAKMVLEDTGRGALRFDVASFG
jgi:hypothetical protein